MFCVVLRKENRGWAGKDPRIEKYRGGYFIKPLLTKRACVRAGKDTARHYGVPHCSGSAPEPDCGVFIKKQVNTG